MTTRARFFVVVFCGLVAVCATACPAENKGEAGQDLAGWRYYLPLTIPKNASSVIKLYLPPALIAKAQPSLADLRIVNNRGDQVAYVIREQRGKTGEFAIKAPAAYINRTFIAGKSSRVIVDFGGSKPRDFLEISTSGDNFRRKTTIEASADGKAWQVIADNVWLFAIPRANSVFRVNRVHMPVNNFRYYRITVFNGDDDRGRIVIKEVLASGSAPQPADVTTVPVVGTGIMENSKNRYTEIRLDLGYENLRLCDVGLEFADQQFFRVCDIFGRNQEKRIIIQQVENALPRKIEVEEPWVKIARGRIYRFPNKNGTAVGLTLPCRGTCRFLAIRVYNNDDKRLTFISAKVRRYRQWILFPAKTNESAKLYFGNSKALAPRYDLSNYIDSLAAKGIHLAAVGEVRKNPGYKIEEKSVPWSEQHKWLLTAVILVLILIMGGLILRQTGQIPSMRD